jgi:sRNA-binding regulator protein Hfq
MVNRKLIRPNLQQIKEKYNGNTMLQEAPEPAREPSREPKRDQRGGSRPRGRDNAQSQAGPRRRAVPPEATNAEAFYYLKQMNTQTPMVVELDNGEKIHGCIEWYDRTCLKVNRTDGPNLLLFKHAIRYLYKQEEES